MKRLLLPSGSFVRVAKRLVKKSPHIASEIQETLELLSNDVFHTQLKSHKLKGDLKGSRACTVGYNLRIVFDFVEYEG